MKQYLHKSLEDCGEIVSFAIKKANSYMSLKTQHLQFLDIRSYLAPNYSYDAFHGEAPPSAFVGQTIRP
jgi:hypothetical protein